MEAPSYLAQLICNKKFEREERGKVPPLFWRHPRYRQLFAREISQAHVLLRKYHPNAIIMALKMYDARFIKSLRNKNLLPLIEKCQGGLKDKVFVQTENTTTGRPRKAFSKSVNLMGKL